MGDWERGGTVGPPAEPSHPPAQDSHESPFCTGCTGHASAQPGSAPQDQTRAHITVPLLPQRLRTASNRRASRRDAGRLVPLWSVPAALRPSGRLGWRLVGGVAWAVCLTPVGRTCKQTAPSDDRHSDRPDRETCGGRAGSKVQRLTLRDSITQARVAERRLAVHDSSPA